VPAKIFAPTFIGLCSRRVSLVAATEALERRCGGGCVATTRRPPFDKVFLAPNDLIFMIKVCREAPTSAIKSGALCHPVIGRTCLP
jgi:hypothetical protein